jgi:O-antigen/teichoic acid export membrane protein
MPFMGWTIFRALYSQCDPVILSIISNDTAVGWYAVAFRLSGTALFFPTALCAALLPTLSRLHGESRAEFQLLVRRTVSLVLLCSLPLALVLICLPENLVRLMHYPQSLAGAIPVLRMSGVVVVLDSVAAVLGTTAIASDGQRGMARASLGACIVGIPACFLGSYLTHRLWGNGAIGAMASDAVVEVFLLAAYARLLPRTLFNRGTVGFIGRCLLASVPVAVFLLVACRTGIGIWAVIPSGAVYVAACWACGCLDPEYVALARRVISRKLEPKSEIAS